MDAADDTIAIGILRFDLCRAGGRWTSSVTPWPIAMSHILQGDPSGPLKPPVDIVPIVLAAADCLLL